MYIITEPNNFTYFRHLFQVSMQEQHKVEGEAHSQMLQPLTATSWKGDNRVLLSILLGSWFRGTVKQLPML